MNLHAITPKENSDPLPPTRGKWKAFLNNKWKPKQDFYVDTDRDRNAVLTAAKRHGVKVTSRKLDGGGYRIWRVK